MAGLNRCRVLRRAGLGYLAGDGRKWRHLKYWGFDVVEGKNVFSKALSSVVEARTREASRQLGYRHQHQLIGALTKRP